MPGSAFCPSCGRPVSLVAMDSPNAPLAAVSLPANVAGALCYLVGWVTGVLFLVLEPYRRDPFVRFHAIQSIFFNVAWIVAYVGLAVFQSFLPWSLFHAVGILSRLLSLFCGCLALWLMYRAYNKGRFKLPILGDLAERQA